MILFDTGALVAAANDRDTHHHACVEHLTGLRLAQRRLLLPTTMIQTSTDAGATWSTTRYLTVPGLGMVGSMTGSAAIDQISNLHGDVIASELHQPGPVTIDAYTETGCVPASGVSPY